LEVEPEQVTEPSIVCATNPTPPCCLDRASGLGHLLGAESI
jgi:hypothetical protein